MRRPQTVRRTVRRTARLAAPLAVTVLVGSVTAGCASGTESYCDTLAEQKQQLQRLSAEAGKAGAEDADVTGRSLEMFERLRDEAPDDVVDEWDTFVRAWRGLAEAVDEDEADAVREAAEQLRTPRVVEAAAGLEQHALDVCKVDLSTSGLDF